MSRSANEGRDLSWLPADEQAWVAEHHAALDEIFVAFLANGEWPDPVQLQRELRARGSKTDLSRALEQMPPLIGFRRHAPDQVVLTFFGIGCCVGSELLLGQLVEVVKLAIERFDSVECPLRLSRSEVDSHLRLNEADGDRLSEVILQDPFFLSGGLAGVRTWNQQISEQVLRFEGIDEPRGLLGRLAELRGVGKDSGSITERPSFADRVRTRWRKQGSLVRVTEIVVGTVLSAFVLALIGSAFGLDLIGGGGTETDGGEVSDDPVPPTPPADPVGDRVRLGCPGPPGQPRRPDLRIRVVAWCALPGVREQGQFKLKVWVENTGEKTLDISHARWYLLVGELDPGRWSPPKMGPATTEEPFRIDYQGDEVWAIPANADGAYDPIPDRPGYATFATHWGGLELAPGEAFKPSLDDEDQGVLVFNVPNASEGVSPFSSVVGLGYLDGRQVVALCPRRAWEKRLAGDEF